MVTFHRSRSLDHLEDHGVGVLVPENMCLKPQNLMVLHHFPHSITQKLFGWHDSTSDTPAWPN